MEEKSKDEHLTNSISTDKKFLKDHASDNKYNVLNRFNICSIVFDIFNDFIVHASLSNAELENKSKIYRK